MSMYKEEINCKRWKSISSKRSDQNVLSNVGDQFKSLEKKSTGKWGFVEPTRKMITRIL